MKNRMKLRSFLGYGFSSLGTGFFVVTVFFIFNSYKQIGSSTVIYPYTPLVAPALISGLVFFNAGLVFIWNEYLFSKQRKKVQLQLALIEENKKQQKA